MTTQCVVRAAERPSRSETLDVPKNIANSPKTQRLRKPPLPKVIPLLGEMSRSDKRVMESVASRNSNLRQPLLRFPKVATVLKRRQLLTAAPSSPRFIIRRMRSATMQITASCHALGRHPYCKYKSYLNSKKKNHPFRMVFLFGASSRTRTYDNSVNSRVLYRLSY